MPACLLVYHVCDVLCGLCLCYVPVRLVSVVQNP
jgi:hypothetical protein